MNSGTKDSLEAGAGLTLLDGSLLNNHFKMEVEEGFCSPKPSDIKVRCVTIQPGSTARLESAIAFFTTLLLPSGLLLRVQGGDKSDVCGLFHVRSPEDATKPVSVASQAA